MTAVDTNIIIRLLARDDEAQYQAARRLFDTYEVFVPVTVVLEAVWVLETVYSQDRPAVASALDGLLGFPNVNVRDERALKSACEWYREGLDFADGLHLALSQRASHFATFDKALISRAPSGSTTIVVDATT